MILEKESDRVNEKVDDETDHDMNRLSDKADAIATKRRNEISVGKVAKTGFKVAKVFAKGLVVFARLCFFPFSFIFFKNASGVVERIFRRPRAKI